MAIFRAQTTNAADHATLVDQLVREISRDARHGQPFIYVNDIGQTGTYHVTVIWDAWRNLSQQQRSRVILDAFARHEPAITDRITIAMGLTGEEAHRLGLLRHKVQLLDRHHEPADRGRAEQLMRDEGAFETAQGLQLLFRTEDQANKAYERLQTAAPGPWVLVREEPEYVG